MARRRAGGVRKDKEWAGLPSIALALTSAGTTIGSNLTLGAPFTVLRMLGEVGISNTGSVTGGDSAVITVAIGVVSADAAALGSTALPDPGSEASYPWLFWASRSLYFPVTGAPLDPASPMSAVRWSFDVRSMRKMKPREALVWAVEYEDISGTPPIRVDLSQTRVLLAS